MTDCHFLNLQGELQISVPDATFLVQNAYWNMIIEEWQLAYVFVGKTRTKFGIKIFEIHFVIEIK